MSDKNNNIRTLILVMILLQYSSPEKNIEWKEVNTYLEKHSCKPLSRDAFGKIINKIEIIQNLDLWNKSFGKLVKVRNGNHNAFYMKNLFDESEVRILADLIYATKALSENESKKMIAKLDKLINFSSLNYRRDDLIKIKNIKTKIDIKQNIKSILEAISLGKKLSFNYCDYDINKQLVCKLTDSGIAKVYTVTPIEIFLKKDFYYLVLKRDNKDSFANYRIDKICNIKILHEESTVDKNNFDLVNHINKSVYMFVGEEYEIELEIDKMFRGLVLDEFGRDIRITMLGNSKSKMLCDSNKILITFKSTIDDGLISWIMQLRSHCKVIKPESLKNKVIEETKKVLTLYN